MPRNQIRIAVDPNAKLLITNALGEVIVANPPIASAAKIRTVILTINAP